MGINRHDEHGYRGFCAPDKGLAAAKMVGGGFLYVCAKEKRYWSD